MLPYIIASVGGFLVASGLKRGGGVKTVMADDEMMYARGGGVNGFVEYSRLSPQEWELVEWSLNGHSPSFRGRFYFQKGTGFMFIQKENGEIYKPQSSNKLFWREIKGSNVRMAQGGNIRKIKGNNFSEQIANGQKFKALIQKVFEDQKEDAYPLEFIKATALTPHPIVKIEGKNYISFKGTYSHEEFMDDPNFIQALEYVDRPKIRAK